MHFLFLKNIKLQQKQGFCRKNLDFGLFSSKFATQYSSLKHSKIAIARLKGVTFNVRCTKIVRS